MHQILKTVHTILFYVCAAMLAAIAAITVLDVIGRYIGRPLPGANELIGLILVVIIVCGVGITQKAGGHIAVNVVVDRFPLLIRRILVLTSLISGFIVAVLISWQAIPFALESKNAFEHTEILRFPWYPLKFIIFFGAGIWALQYMIDAVQVAKRLFSNAPELTAGEQHGTDVI